MLSLNLNKLTIIICFISFSFYSEASHAQTKITLQDAINRSLQNNNQVKKSVVAERESELNVYKAQVNKYPSLNFATSGNLDFGRTLNPTTNEYITQNAIASTQNLSSNVVLFSGFQKSNQIEQNKLLFEVDKSSTQKVKNDLIVQVVYTYLSILSYRDQLSVAKEQLDVAAQFLDFETKRLAVGRRTAADVSKAKSELDKIEVNITTLQNQYNNSVLDLEQLMGENTSTNYTLVEPLVDTAKNNEKNIAEIFQYAAQNLPEIRGAQLTTEVAVKSVNIAKSGYYPQLSLSAAVASDYIYQFHFEPSLFGPYQQYSFLTQLHTNLYEYIGLNLTIPIFNSFNAKINVKKATLDVESARINEQIAKDNLYKIIMQAKSDLDAARKNYDYALQSLSASTDAFDAMQKRYKIGSSSSYEFSLAQDDFNLAQFTVIATKYNLVFKKKVLDFYSGIPISY